MVLGLGSYRLSQRGFLVKRLTAAETMGSVTRHRHGQDRHDHREPHDGRGASSPPSGATRCSRDALGAVAPYEDTPVDGALRARRTDAGVRARAGRIVRERELGDGGKTKAALRERTAGCDAVRDGRARGGRSRSAPRVPAGTREALARETAAGHRVIAVATRVACRPASGTPRSRTLEHGMTLAGFVSFVDPPRAGVAETVRRGGRRGHPARIMVTGRPPGHRGARSPPRSGSPAGARVVTGPELDDARRRRPARRSCARCRVFARDDARAQVPHRAGTAGGRRGRRGDGRRRERRARAPGGRHRHRDGPARHRRGARGGGRRAGRRRLRRRSRRASSRAARSSTTCARA